MTRRIEKELNYFKYDGSPLKFRLGTLLVMISCIMLLIISTFTELHFKHIIIPFDIFSNWSTYFTDMGIYTEGFIKTVKYIPQIPVIFFILALLDRKFSMITILCYITLGFLGYPIFALGGGWRYITQYGVGYILSYIPALFFSGSILNRRYNFLTVLKAVFAGIIIINIIGALVLLIIACFKHENGFMIKNLLYSMSGFKFMYDLGFSILAIYLGLIVKKLLWIIMS